MVALRHVCTAIMFLFAVGRLFFVHGCRGGVLLIFALPPVFAYLVTLRDASRWNRRLAESFLVLLGVGVILAWLDRLPQMFHRLENLSPVDSRTLSWYLSVYLLSLGIVPPYAFGRSLWHGRRGSEAVYSRYECGIGLTLWCGYFVLLAVYPSEFLSTMFAVLARYCGSG